MTIEMTYGYSTNINFVVPTTSVASITSTGISSIGSPTFANVTIGGMEENVLRNYLARSNSNFTDIT